MLYIKHLPIFSFAEPIAFVHRDCSFYKVDDIQTLTRVEIQGGQYPLYAFLHIVEDSSLVAPDEIGLNDEAFLKLNLPEGAIVSILQAETPQSLEYILKKSEGNTLTPREYGQIITDIETGKYSNTEIASFVTAFKAFADIDDIVALTQALSFGNRLYWDEENIIADTHTLGYVPANPTDIIVTAIVAAYGLPILKSVILNPHSYTGPAHTMQVFANLDTNDILLKKKIKEAKGAIFNYESLNSSQAILKLKNISDSLNLKDEKMEISLIFAMKINSGISHLLIDIPVGSEALIKTKADSLRLRKIIEQVSQTLKIDTDIVITDGREPVGTGIGAVLEAKDIMQILRNKKNAPQDLLEKSLFIAGKVLEFDPKLKSGQGYEVAKEMIVSKRALAAFEQIINTQGKLQSADLGNLTREVIANSNGKIQSVSNQILSKIAKVAGLNSNAGVGIELFKKVGDKVSKGEALYKIYANNSAELMSAVSLAETLNGYEIGK